MKHLSQARFSATLILGALLCASSARVHAQTGGAPDLSDFGGAIAQGVEDAPQTARATKGPIASGLIVPRVKPGHGAHALFEAMRQKARQEGVAHPEMLQAIAGYNDLEKQAPKIIEAMEAEMKKQGFAPRDIGTAYTFTFLQGRENATGKTTTPVQDKAVGRRFASILPGVLGAKWKTIKPADKENLYETMLMGIALSQMVIEQADKNGASEKAAAFRQDAIEGFQSLFGVSPAQVEIADDGQISGMTPATPEDAVAPTEAPADGAPEDAPQ